MKIKNLSFLLLLLCVGFSALAQSFVMVLGTAQDGGYPHMGCSRQCCQHAWRNASARRYVVSLALVDPAARQWWLFEATPDIKEQLQYFKQLTKGAYNYLPDGVFITHAHIGHYTGLMQMGREVMNTNNLPVYTLPRLKKYFEENGPWSQLVKLQNIELHELEPGAVLDLSKRISVEAFTVPHRDEYSETAGFTIKAGNKKYLFIPDINKWGRWSRDIIKQVQSVDVALLDATFYNTDELGKIDIKQVPHPFVTETIELFDRTDAATKAKIHFIHLNHTNPLMWDSKMRAKVLKQGYRIAVQGLRL